MSATGSLCAGTYVAYLVTTKTGQAGGGKTEAAVRRRFNDFVSLADMVKLRWAWQPSSSSLHASPALLQHLATAGPKHLLPPPAGAVHDLGGSQHHRTSQ